MKIVLEFENISDFFTQLPRFATLMNFSGQFANITKKPKSDSEPTLEEPDLPVIEHPEEGVTRVHGTKTETAEQAGKKIEAAYDAAEATEVAAPKPAKEPTDEAEAPEAAEDAPKKAAKPGKAGKSKKAPAPEDDPAEAPQDAPEGEVKDADVRKALNALIKAGKRDEVKAILKSFGAENFSKLTANQYPAVLKKAKEALGDD